MTRMAFIFQKFFQNGFSSSEINLACAICCSASLSVDSLERSKPQIVFTQPGQREPNSTPSSSLSVYVKIRFLRFQFMRLPNQ